jgi:hypothetical protein
MDMDADMDHGEMDDERPQDPRDEQDHQRYKAMRMYCPLCGTANDHVLVQCRMYVVNAQICQYCKKWDHYVSDCARAHFACSNFLETHRNPRRQTSRQMTWDE